MTREVVERVLAIDAGTQSMRALVFDATGVLIDMAKVVYDTPYHEPKPGFAEQEAPYYFSCLVEACQLLWQQGKVNPDSICAMSVTTQRGTVVNLDRDGQPLRPAMLWLDQRQAKHIPALGPIWGNIFRITRLTGTLQHLQREAEINWQCENEPTVWEQTQYFLFLSGYLNYRLTGEFADSVGSQVGYVPFDYRKQTWAPKQNWKWKALAVRPETLPRLVAVGTELGQVSARAARETGLPPGLPVYAGASDKACEVIGSGCLDVHQGCIGYGTTATISVNSGHYVEPIRLLPPYPSAIPGDYNLEVQVFRGLWMVSWFKAQFAELEQIVANQNQVTVESLLDELAVQAPVGSSGLMLQPFWSPGVKYPGPEAKGCIIGFGGVHTKNHMYRALLEGLAFALYEGRERIETCTGVALSELYVCGGGTHSKLMMQITADMFALPVRLPVVSETSGLGAAMIAASGIGLHTGIESAVKSMTRFGESYEPNSTHTELYQQLYERVYRKIYRRLRPLYRSIREITGYPQ